MSMVVVTAGRSTITLVDPVAVIVVVNPGRLTKVSIPLTVTWVCSDGIVTSVEPSPMKWNAVCLDSKDSVSVVASKDQVVVKGAVKSTASWPLTVAVKITVLPASVVAEVIENVMVERMSSVCVLKSLNSTVVSAAATSTTERVCEITDLLSYSMLARFVTFAPSRKGVNTRDQQLTQ